MPDPSEGNTRDPDASGGGTGHLTLPEVRRRAVAGAAAVVLRGVAIQLASLAGNIFLAHLLVPKDFGHAAFGLALLAPLSLLVSTGLGGAFIANREPPEREDLETLVAVQLTAAIAITVVAAVVLWPLGKTGQVTAVMVASLPILVLRTPGAVLLERELAYKPLVAVEFAESAAFYAWAVPAAFAGWGAWAIATGAIARAVAGSALMLSVGPAGPLRPRFSWQRARGFLGYGTRVQTFFSVILAREQALNAVIGALGGLRMLGLWTVANRILQIPSLVFGSLNRVAFPAMSRVLSAGGDPRPLIERAVALTAVCTGLILVPLVGATPALVPSVLGHRWIDARLVIPWASLGLMVGGPVTVASSAFLWAKRDTTPLRAILLVSVTWLILTSALIPVIGITAIGLAWMAASCVDGLVLGRRAGQRTGAAIFRPLVTPLAIAVAGAAAGWFTAAGSTSFVWAVVGGAVAESVYLAGLTVFRRGLLVDAVKLTKQALRRSSSAAEADLGSPVDAHLVDI
jgi:O-antigen/teichoic acid export membrane protein